MSGTNMNHMFDYHIHTTNSSDGRSTMAEICQSAYDRGLKEIAITDHFEPSKEDENCSSYKPEMYFQELDKAKQRFRGRLIIKAGVELGQPHLFKESTDRLINNYDYDYILASAHKLPNGLDVSQLDYRRLELDDVYNIYLAQLERLALYGQFDCVGHLDLIKRYCNSYYDERITLCKKEDQLAAVLVKLIDKGKGIEINTSGLRQGPKETMPGIDVLKLYRKLGGEILTVGSDSHHKDDVGKGIADAVELALEAGFRYLTVFTERVPEWKRISLDRGIYSISSQLNIS